MNYYKNMNVVPRMRTLPAAFKEIKEIDPNTSVSMRSIRKIVSSGQIPSVEIANKKLINLDLLLDWLACYNNMATGA